jgi:flagellar protein FlgJ
MKETHFNTSLYIDFQNLARLRSRTRRNPQENLREVAGQFEALFIQMMLKNAIDTGLEGGSLNSDQTNFYKEMFHKQMATEIADKGGIGLADIIIRQMDRQIDESSEKSFTSKRQPHAVATYTEAVRMKAHNPDEAEKRTKS